MTTSFELTLEDTSPVISYFPFAETLGAANLSAGWNSYFSQSGFLSQLGQTGMGQSMHVTSLDGAVFAIQWFGTGISLFGSVEDATYDVAIDGAAPFPEIPQGYLLAGIQGLPLKQHFVALSAHPAKASPPASSYLAFDRAVLNVSTNLTGAQVSSEFVNASSSRWFFSGAWSELSDPVLSSQPSQSYRVTTSRGNTATIAFRGSAVSLTGIRNVTNGHYNVTLDGTTTTFDGHSDWLETSTLFLQAGLDESVRHSLTVTNSDDASLTISGLNITHVSGGTPVADSSASGLPTATIVALVLTVLIAVLAVMTLVACIYFHRRHRPRRPTVTMAGIQSSTFFRDFDVETWSPPRNGKGREHPPRPSRRSSDYATQELHIAQPLERNSQNESDASIVLIKNSRLETVDPMSPTPYLRLPKHSPLKVDWDEGGGDSRVWEREGSTWNSARESVRTSISSVVREPHGGSPVDLVMPTPDPMNSPGSRHTRRRSRSMEAGPSSRRLRLEIPNQPSSTDPNETLLTSTPRSATSQRPRRSSLLQYSLRGSRRANISRMSSGASQLLSSTQETHETPASISTIQFRRRPWDENRSQSGSEHTLEDPPPPPKVVSEFLQQLRAQRMDRVA